MNDAEAIEAAYFQIVQEQFKLLVIDTDSHALFGHGAINRFVVNVRHARDAKDEALKALNADGSSI